MTQTPEMPNSLFLSPGLGGIVGFEQFPTSTEYIRRAVSKEEAERLSRVVDFTLEYFEEEFPQEAFPGVWNEPLSPYAGGMTPNDLVELSKLLEANK